MNFEELQVHAENRALLLFRMITAAAKPLHTCHQYLFDEIHFSPEQFHELAKTVQCAEDAYRLVQHPKCPEDLAKDLTSQHDFSSFEHVQQ